MRFQRDVLIAILAFALGSTTVIAAAGLVGADGVIRACANGAGVLRVLGPGESCRGSETALSWNQSEGQGSTGATGPTGATGATGPAGTFPLTSPNGQYSIQLTDAGIVLRGPNEAITLANGVVSIHATRIDNRADNDFVVNAGGTFDAQANSHVNIRASASATLQSGGNTTLQAGGLATISGGQTIIGATACGPAFRQSDQALVSVPSVPGTFPVQLITGSTDVLIC